MQALDSLASQSHLTSSALYCVRSSSQLAKFGRKYGQVSPKKPHDATDTGVAPGSVVNTSSTSTPAIRNMACLTPPHLH